MLSEGPPGDWWQLLLDLALEAVLPMCRSASPHKGEQGDSTQQTLGIEQDWYGHGYS